MVGQIIGGEYDEILIRKKSNTRVEIGELLVTWDGIMVQIFDEEYQSLIEGNDIARMSGMELEGYGGLEVKERNLRNYVQLLAKPVFDLNTHKTPKGLPDFFGYVRRITESDFRFLRNSNGALYLGRVRSGTKVLDIPVRLDAHDVLSHHMLVPATTGRGKSNFMKVMLWHLVDASDVGILVLDAHNEYYEYVHHGKRYGLSVHPAAKGRVYLYSPNPPAGMPALKINIRSVRPHHLKEIMEFTSAQEDAMYLAVREWGNDWIAHLLMGGALEGVRETTLAALQRKVQVALDIECVNGRLVSRGNIFTVESGNGESTISTIAEMLDRGATVILDTGTMSGELEILLASMIMTEVFRRHKRCKEGRAPDCDFAQLPVVSVVLEEAPRVLGGEGGNIFKTIAREGRKFNVGLIAITQLPSMIPREIMANLNTKFILANETKSERDAIISTAAQDLSKDSKLIASLEKGEALVSSIFTRFAIPVMVDRFEDVVDAARKSSSHENVPIKPRF
ncbi:MAG: ATP-binding protein [Euryarchaeota archaeon]|nr:ATP-binding protein [Euryarchaeota archaeon]